MSEQIENQLRDLDYCLKCGELKQINLVFCWKCWRIFKYYNGSQAEFIFDDD